MGASDSNPMLIVYCSGLPHHVPPFTWYNLARQISLQVPVVFVELGQPRPSFNLKSLGQFGRWWWSVGGRHQPFKLWNFQFWLAWPVLWFYLLFFKYARGYRIVCLTNLPDPDPVYKFIPADINILEAQDHCLENEFEVNRDRVGNFDWIFTNTEVMTKLLLSFNPRVKLLASGYHQPLSRVPQVKKPVKPLPRSVIFSGGISHRLDYDTTYQLAKLLPDYTFIFMGEMYLGRHYVDQRRDALCLKKWRRLLALPNVEYLGALTAEDSVKILPFFTVGLIPYAADDLMNYYSHPVKLYDYLAAGLPVVSTPLPAVTHYQKRAPVWVAKTASDLAKAVKQATQKVISLRQRQEIDKILAEQSSDRRISQMLAIVTHNHDH